MLYVTTYTDLLWHMLHLKVKPAHSMCVFTRATDQGCKIASAQTLDDPPPRVSSSRFVTLIVEPRKQTRHKRHTHTKTANDCCVCIPLNVLIHLFRSKMLISPNDAGDGNESDVGNNDSYIQSFARDSRKASSCHAMRSCCVHMLCSRRMCRT